MLWEESGEGHRSLNFRYSLFPNINIIMSGNSDIYFQSQPCPLCLLISSYSFQGFNLIAKQFSESILTHYQIQNFRFVINYDI